MKNISRRNLLRGAIGIAGAGASAVLLGPKMVEAITEENTANLPPEDRIEKLAKKLGVKKRERAVVAIQHRTKTIEMNQGTSLWGGAPDRDANLTIQGYDIIDLIEAVAKRG